jgi:hypothetical protein
MKVYALKDNVKQYVKHPRGTNFDKQGSADWPMDSFTTRRIRDGDISLEAPSEMKAAAPKSAAKI